MRCTNPKWYRKLLISSTTNRNNSVDNSPSHDEFVHLLEKLGNIPDEEILPDTRPLSVNGDAIIKDVLSTDVSLDEVSIR